MSLCPAVPLQNFFPVFLLFFIATKKKWMKELLLLGNHGPQQNNYKSCSIDWWPRWVSCLRMLHAAFPGSSHTDIKLHCSLRALHPLPVGRQCKAALSKEGNNCRDWFFFSTTQTEFGWRFSFILLPAVFLSHALRTSLPLPELFFGPPFYIFLQFLIILLLPVWALW